MINHIIYKIKCNHISVQKEWAASQEQTTVIKYILKGLNKKSFHKKKSVNMVLSVECISKVNVLITTHFLHFPHLIRSQLLLNHKKSLKKTVEMVTFAKNTQTAPLSTKKNVSMAMVARTSLLFANLCTRSSNLKRKSKKKWK